MSRVLTGPRPAITDPDTGEPRPATDHEIRQRGVAYAGTVDGTDVWDSVADDLVHAALGLTVLAEDTPGVRRWDALPEAMRTSLERVAIYRDVSAPRLRTDVEATLGRAVAVPRAVASGAALDEARRLKDREDSSVRLLVLRASETVDTDIVAETGIRPHAWQGER